MCPKVLFHKTMAIVATVHELGARWTVLCQTLRVSEAATNKWWTIVRDGMQEKQRHYHTLTHLEELFAHADAFKSHLRDPCAVDLAIFFHDVVYNPRAGGGKNEDDSAVVFSNFAQEVDLEPATLAKVFRWIVQTKHHRCDESDDDDCKFFMDFDMAVLGWERAAYARYAQDVRKEFIHVPEGIWCKARAAFLEITAEVPAIYATAAFRERFDAPARANLRWEAEQLRDAFAKLSVSQKVVAAAYSYKTFLGGFVVVGTLGGTLGGLVLACPHVCGRLLVGVSGVCASSALLLGAYLGLRAPFVRYPYPTTEKDRDVCIYAGSFNPPHNGHIEVARYLASKHARVVMVIGASATKRYPVDPHVRRVLAQRMLKEVGVEGVEVRVVSGYIWRFGFEVAAKRLYRGIRSWRKDGWEEKVLEALNVVGPLALAGRCPLPTVYVQANPRWAHISSTLLRDCVRKGTGVEELVPPAVAKDVLEAYSYLAS